jgi:hypothetical protein
MTRRTALVTGGTSGIGAAFARRLAADSYDLVLVARDQRRLRERAGALAREFGVAVEVLPADLATEEGVGAVAERLAGQGGVDLLVNNAGLTLNRSFLRSDPEAEERMLRLNVHAVMRLTLAALPGMVSRGHGGVINVSSVAGFAVTMPGSTYSATKAWVNNFTESVAASVRPYGVRMMALCPGYVRTEFHQRAGIDMSRTPRALWLDADRVVEDALRAFHRGRVIRVVDWRYRTVVAAMRFVPGRLVRAVARDTRGRIGPAGR